MLRTIEATYKNGEIIPLEKVDAAENSKLLVVILDNIIRAIPEGEESVHKGRVKATSSWKAIRGKYKNMLTSVDEFMMKKQDEKKLESHC